MVSKKNVIEETQESTQEAADKLREELDLYKEKSARAMADYVNLEKRMQTQQVQFIKMANLALIEKFLGVLDNLERAGAHIQDPGLSMVIEQIAKLLEEEGVETITPLGQEFNPETMECVEKVEGQKDEVVTVVVKGYRIGDHLIRPAKVTVGESKSKNN
jgi:molecular chaperone GrpE